MHGSYEATIILFDKRFIMLKDKSAKVVSSVRLDADNEVVKDFTRIDIPYKDEKASFKNKVATYFVNSEDAELVFPVLKELVRNRTLKLEEDLVNVRGQLRDEYVLHGQTIKKLRALEAIWFVRAWVWFAKNVIKKLIPEE